MASSTRAMQDSVDQPDVVPGGDGVEAERDRAVQQRGELDLLVAPQARVRGAPGGVLGQEVGDHILDEIIAEIPDVVRDPEQVTDPAGVERVLDGAAAAGSGAQRPWVAGQGHVHAGDVMAGVHRERGGDRRIDPAAHRGQDPHQVHILVRAFHECWRIEPTLCRADGSSPSRTGQRGLARALHHRTDGLGNGNDVGGCRGVPEGEPQRSAGVLLVQPHRQQHV